MEAIPTIMILASQTTNPQQGRPSLGKELRLFLRRCQYATMDAEIVCTARLSDGLCQFRVGNDIGPVGVTDIGCCTDVPQQPEGFHADSRPKQLTAFTQEAILKFTVATNEYW